MEIESEHPEAVATEPVAQTGSKKLPGRRLTFGAMIAIVATAIFHQSQPEPLEDYLSVVPEIRMVSSEVLAIDKCWSAEGKSLENNNLKHFPWDTSRHRSIRGPNPEDYETREVWYRIDNIREGMSWSGMQILDRAGNKIDTAGTGSGGAPNGWEYSEFGFPVGEVPDVVDLKWHFYPEAATTIASIEPGVTPLPFQLPNGGRIARLGNTDQLNRMRGIPSGRFFVHVDYAAHYREQIEVEIEPKWISLFSLFDTSRSTDMRMQRQHSYGVQAYRSWLKVWHNPTSQPSRIDINVRTRRTAVYRNVAFTNNNAPTDHYVAIEPAKWSIFPSLSTDNVSGSEEIEFIVTWPQSDWSLRKSELPPSPNLRWKSYLRLDDEEFEIPSNHIPFESGSFELDISALTDGRFTWARGPRRMQYVLKDVDVVHPSKPDRVFHLPEIASWADPFIKSGDVAPPAISTTQASTPTED